MKAVVLYGPHDVRVTDNFPEKPVGDGDVKVRVAYCGICGSDLHKVAGKKNTHPITYPVPLGHEISGVVEAVGKNVTGFRPGDRVTVDPNWSCGRCSWCQAGKPSFCANARGVVKGMAEYVVSPEENVYHLPDGMDMKDAALAEPVACCLHGMDLLDVHLGESVAIVGLGAIGSIMLQLVKAAGAADIFVLDCDTSKAGAAIEMGATGFVDSADADAVKALAESRVINRVIECVGVAPAQQTALTVAGKGATVVLFGVADEADRLSLSCYEAFTKELVIKTSFVNPHTTARAVALLAAGILDTSRIISGVLTMEEAVPELSERRYIRAGKVLVQIGDSI